MRYIGIVRAVLLVGAVVGATSANGQSLTGPRGFRCEVAHPYSGQMVVAFHVNNPNIPFWAMAEFLPNGALISYSPAFYQLPAIMQRLTLHHECGHLDIPTRNEFEANCYALEKLDQEGALTPQAVSIIRNTHCSIGPLGPQYGGSGRAFWNMTLQKCSLNLPPC